MAAALAGQKGGEVQRDAALLAINRQMSQINVIYIKLGADGAEIAAGIERVSCLASLSLSPRLVCRPIAIYLYKIHAI